MPSWTAACRELLTDGVDGYLVEPHNAEMLAERTSRVLNGDGVEMGTMGRLTALKRFGIGRMARQYLLLYRQVISARSAGLRERASSRSRPISDKSLTAVLDAMVGGGFYGGECATGRGLAPGRQARGHVRLDRFKVH